MLFGDIDHALLAAWIKAFSHGQRTAFDLNELQLVDEYAYILYGSQNLIVPRLTWTVIILMSVMNQCLKISLSSKMLLSVALSYVNR